jgi:hypothetical protein
MLFRTVFFFSLAAFALCSTTKAQNFSPTRLKNAGQSHFASALTQQRLRTLVQTSGSYVCGDYNDPTNTRCLNEQNCCRNHRVARPYNYCCPGTKSCDGDGGCR